MTTRDDGAIYRDEARGIGALLSEYQAAAGLTTTECANTIGCARKSWESWTMGRGKPTGLYARRIIDRLFKGMAEAFSLLGTGSRGKLRNGHALLAPALGGVDSDKAIKRHAAAKHKAFLRKRRHKIEARHRVLQARKKRNDQFAERMIRNDAQGPHEGVE